jgi:very-short-patch-repair endonuclease
MFLGASKQMFANASALRKNMTKAEITLWEYLRTKPFGIKFRR